MGSYQILLLVLKAGNCLVHVVQLVLRYLVEPRGWSELVPTACLNGAAEFTSPCFILRE